MARGLDRRRVLSRGSRALVATSLVLIVGACSTHVQADVTPLPTVRGVTTAPATPPGPASSVVTVRPTAPQRAASSSSRPSRPPAQPSTPPVNAQSGSSVQFSLVMAGDVLPHNTVEWDADKLVKGANTYDFAPMMAPIRPWIENADLALCSLEVPIAPVGEKITGYPLFAAPKDLATSLKQVGWDGCATANNHSLDKGKAGVKRTLEVLEAAGLGHTGTGRTPRETPIAQFYRVTKNGVSLTVAHLSATTFINGPQSPAVYSTSVHALKPEQITRLAAGARKAGADIVVFTPHWGTEYRHTPDKQQEDIASKIAAGGMVDVILGGHPHVPEPIKLLPGGVAGRGMWVAYSMGNFLSDQNESYTDLSTSSGLLMRVAISLNTTTGDAKVSGVTWSGTSVDTRGGHRVYPMKPLLEGKFAGKTKLSSAQIRRRWDDMVARIGTTYYDPKPPTEGGAVVTVMPRR